MILYRLQNVCISDEESSINEFWKIREFFQVNFDQNTSELKPVTDTVVNSEHELYVKGTTAVWTKGINDGEPERRLPVTCFTCDTSIQHAFFCPSSFYSCENPDKRNPSTVPKTSMMSMSCERETFGICLIDALSIRVYTPSGEDYRASLEFPVSNVWQTKTCLLLERNATNAVIENDTISMPRLFSISHPLHELCPVLIKSNSGAVNFLTETDYRVIFTNAENDLVMLYDNHLNRHFLARLRPATVEEKQFIGGEFCI